MSIESIPPTITHHPDVVSAFTAEGDKAVRLMLEGWRAYLDQNPIVAQGVLRVAGERNPTDPGAFIDGFTFGIVLGGLTATLKEAEMLEALLAQPTSGEGGLRPSNSEADR